MKSVFDRVKKCTGCAMLLKINGEGQQTLHAKQAEPDMSMRHVSTIIELLACSRGQPLHMLLV